MSHQSSITYSSPPFKFVVENKPFYVHRELVAQYSAPLERMMNGGMKETQEGFATLEDVDEGTFVRFLEFLYNGYYTSAEHKVVTRSRQSESISNRLLTNQDDSVVSDVALHSPSSLTIHETTSRQPPSDRLATSQAGQMTLMIPKYRSTRKGAREAFKDSSMDTCVRNIVRKAGQPRPNESEDEDYSEVFLSHARVWAFANMYQIPLLKRLAIEELHAVLAVFHLYSQRCSDIVALLRYLYTENPASCSEEGSKWRLMQHYMAAEMETLVKNEEFQSLIIENGGPLLRDVMMVVARRLA